MGGLKYVCHASLIKSAQFGRHGTSATGVEAGRTINNRHSITAVVRHVILTAHFNSSGGAQNFSKQTTNTIQRLQHINRKVRYDEVVESVTIPVAVRHQMIVKTFTVRAYSVATADEVQVCCSLR